MEKAKVIENINREKRFKFVYDMNSYIYAESEDDAWDKFYKLEISDDNRLFQDVRYVVVVDEDGIEI
jgi:hypothetical protein